MSGAREHLIASMVVDGWRCIGRGPMGELWRLDGREVAVPYGLTPDSWEWPGVIKRVRGQRG